MDTQLLQSTVKKLMSKGKGILAADESIKSANKRLESVGIEPSEEMRQQFRELFIDTPGIEEFLSGIILFDETIRQSDSSGRPFTEILKSKGIAIGIKVDQGLADVPNLEGETLTQGLEGLKERLKEYNNMGAVFAKWRAAFLVSEHSPTMDVIAKNADEMTEYVAICHQQGMVPIVEPEVLFDGDHTIELAGEVTEKVLKTVMDSLDTAHVFLSGVIIKTSMVLAGSESVKSSPEEVADATVRVLKASVPEMLGGIVFLSGGQTPEQASLNLGAIARREPLPWEIAFSYARAIQGPALEVWRGKIENFEKARAVFIERLRANCAADRGVIQ